MNMSEMLRAALKARPPLMPALDSAEADAQGDLGASGYTEADIALSAAAVLQQWAETDDLDEGETSADRLQALMIGVADANQDGEITEDEQGVLDVALNAAWDYLARAGVPDEDASALLNDWDAETADRVLDLLASYLPEGEEAADADLDDFVFGEGDQASAFGEDDDRADGYTAEEEWEAMPEKEDEGRDPKAVFDGDFKGHPFRGNQFKSASRESGNAVRASQHAKHAAKKGSAKDVKTAHSAAYYAHKAAAHSTLGKKAKLYHRKMAKFHGKHSGLKLDAVALDAVYKKTMVVRDGKKIRINKRISGTVYRTAKQKMATRKASLKSHSARSKMRRMKSVRLRQRMGL